MMPDTTPEGAGPWSVAVWQDTAWAPLDQGLEGFGVALASDGARLVLAMHEGSIYHQSRTHTVHLFEDGRWRRLGDEMVGAIETLVFWRGMPVIGGHFNLADERKSVNLAVWRNSRWQPLGGGVGGIAVPRVMALADVDGELWVAGRFETAGRQQVTNVGVWDGHVWQTLHGGVDDKVTALAELPEGVVVAGVFTRAGGVPVPGLALFDDGNWQALPAIPKDTKPQAIRGQFCPTPSITEMVVWKRNLVALGDFSFPDDQGDKVIGAAILQGGQWGRLPGSRKWLARDRVDFDNSHGPWRTNTDPPVATPEFYTPKDPTVKIWGYPMVRLWAPGQACTHDTDLFVGGKQSDQTVSAVTVAKVGVSSPEFSMAPVHLWQSDRASLSSWNGRLLVHGSRLTNQTTLHDLALCEKTGWKMPGAWLGDSLISGGDISATTSWCGELIAAGSFHHVADQVVRHVAAYDGERWHPMGQGIPFPSMRDAVLWPRSQDLILFGGVGLNESPTTAFHATCWRWDSRTWTRISLPAGTWWKRSLWSVAGHGDKVWAIGPRMLPEERSPDYHELSNSLYCLQDTTWTMVADCPPLASPELSVWRGSPVVLASRSQGQACNVFRWTDSDWEPVLDQDLPHGRWRIHPTDEALILTKQGQTLAWFEPGWGVGPVTDEDLGINKVTWVDGRAYGLRETRGGNPVLVWDGSPFQRIPGFQPRLPDIKPKRPSKRPINLELPQVTVAQMDSLDGWWIQDGGSPLPEAQVEARGSKGLRIKADQLGSITCRFTPETSTWYRFSGQIGKSSIKRFGCEARLSTAVPDTTRGRPSFKSFSKRLDIDESSKDLELMVPSPLTATSAYFRLGFDESMMEFKTFALEEDPDFFVTRLAKLWHQVVMLWHPPAGRWDKPSPDLPGPISDQAKETFSIDGADSLVHKLLLILDDSRLECSRRKTPGLVIHEKEFGDAKDAFSFQYSSPVSSASCDDLPNGVSVWLTGDIAYRRQYASGGSRWDLYLPILQDLEARGFVLDLREAIDSKPRPTYLVPECLKYLGSGKCK